jgi:hypothetical protein
MTVVDAQGARWLPRLDGRYSDGCSPGWMRTVTRHCASVSEPGHCAAAATEPLAGAEPEPESLTVDLPPSHWQAAPSLSPGTIRVTGTVAGRLVYYSVLSTTSAAAWALSVAADAPI